MDSTAKSLVKTEIMILSDTHGMQFSRDQKPLKHADVAIHCGDLTEEAKLEEYRASIRLLMDIQSPLKLVIAGNHDFTLDLPIFKQKVADSRSHLDSKLVEKEYGYYGEARQLLDDARSAGIIFLDEGSHQFILQNGALLTVYASPYTPSLGDWGFQYHPNRGHEFAIKEGVDLVVTHGPPRGIMDYTNSKQRAGCPDLFRAIARARPRIHCFGHIHEGWGAKLVTWKRLTDNPSHFTDIDNGQSTVVENLSALRPSKFDTPEAKAGKWKRENDLRGQGHIATSHCTEDTLPLQYGAQTLFVNAAIEGTDDDRPQLPWLVEIELPKAM